MEVNTSKEKLIFLAKIYQTGINWCVDVPKEITDSLVINRGKIDILGKINGFNFNKTLMPVKNSFHRLFVNKEMMIGGKTALGEITSFEIQQDYNKKTKNYPIPNLLEKKLDERNLNDNFNSLTLSRKRAILKYLSFIKSEETMIRNVEKVITQLMNNEKNVRIP